MMSTYKKCEDNQKIDKIAKEKIINHKLTKNPYTFQKLPICFYIYILYNLTDGKMYRIDAQRSEELSL